MSTLILDAFNGVFGTHLDVHAIAPTNVPSASWVQFITAFQIGSTGNIAQGVGAAQASPCLVDSGVSDCTVSCDLILGSGFSGGPYAGVAFRGTGHNDYWYAWIRSDTSVIEVINRTGGSNTVVGSVAYTVPTNTTITMVIVLNGTSISVSIGATNVAVTSSVRETATQHGLMADSAVAESIVTWGNFTVATSGGGGSTTTGAGGVQGDSSVVASSLQAGAGAIQAAAAFVASSLVAAEGGVGAVAVCVVSGATGEGQITAQAGLVASSTTGGGNGVQGTAAMVASSLTTGDAGVAAQVGLTASSLAAGGGGVRSTATLVASSLVVGEGGVSASAVCVVGGAIGAGQIAATVTAIASSLIATEAGVGAVGVAVVGLVGPGGMAEVAWVFCPGARYVEVLP